MLVTFAEKHSGKHILRLLCLGDNSFHIHVNSLARPHAIVCIFFRPCSWLFVQGPIKAILKPEAAAAKFKHADAASALHILVFHFFPYLLPDAH